LEKARRSDPGNLKFSHYTHMRPGQGAKWTFDKIPEKGGMRKRYLEFQQTFDKDVKETSLVKLDCASCHQLDATESSDWAVGRSAGDYILPVIYDQHCKACHPLTFSSA